MTKVTIRLSPIRVGAGLSTRKSGLAATQDALDAALGPLEGAIPDLAFLFVAPQFEDELESILQSANASLGGGTGKGLLIVDDLVDTGRTAKVVRDVLPEAHFATVYAKPMGRPMVDTFITEVSQDTWIYFPWDTGLAFQPPIREGEL